MDGLCFFGFELDRIAQVQADINFVGTSLTYNANTRRYGGLELKEIEFSNLKIEHANRPLACYLVANAVLGIMQRLLNRFVTDGIMDMLNESIDDAVKSKY